MADKVRIDIHLCQLLPEQNGLNPDSLRSLQEDSRLSRFNGETLIDIINSLFIQAVGYNQTPLVMKDAFPLKAHSSFYPDFLGKMDLIQKVIALVNENKNPLQNIELHSALKGGRFELTTVTQRVKQWTTRGIWAMSTPLFTLRQRPTSPEILAIAMEYEKEALDLAIFLYDQLSDQPTPYAYTAFPLLNLYHTIALTSPEGPLTWGTLVQTYQSHVTDEEGRAKTLLKNYPFPSLHPLLTKECPLPLTMDSAYRSFHEFVIKMTLKAMEQFLSHTLSHATSEKLFSMFQEDESFRRQFSFFMENPKARLVSFEERSYYKEEQMALCKAFRMAQNLVDLHIPDEEKGSFEGEVFLDWAIASDGQNVLHIDQPDYLGAEPPNHCFPKKIVPMVQSLRALYTKNGETFETHAFSHVMLLTSIRNRPEQFVAFLIQCNTFAPLAITTYQLQQYSHFNEGLDTTSDISYLEGIQRGAPKGLRGSSPEAFNLFLMRTDLPVENRLEMMTLFNQRLNIPPQERIGPTLYFIAFRHFLTGRVTEYHLLIFDLYIDEYPRMPTNQKLDLLIRATEKNGEPRYVYKEGGDELDKEASDPFFLFKTLKLLDPQKEEQMQKVILLFQREFLGGRKIGPNTEKSLRTHFLSSIPSYPSREHINYVIDRMKYLGHDFSEPHQLRVFYELLSLEACRDQIHFNAELIKLLESFTQNRQKMSPRVVAHFLAYHPHLSVEQTRQLQFHFEQLVTHRKECMTKSALNAPFLPEGVVNAIFGNALQIQEILEDKKRANELIKESKIWMTITAPLLNYLYFGSIPLSIRYVTATLPPTVSYKGSPNQALMPLDIYQDLGKQFYGSWEKEEGCYLFRFSVVSKDEKVSYSGKALFPIGPEVFEGNQALPFLLKKFVYHLGYDGGIRNRETDLETVGGFLKHPNVAEAWDAFHPTVGDKEEIGLALFSFCQQLRMGLRQVFLNLATNQKHEGAKLASGRIQFNHLPKLAASGDTFSNGGYHVLVPYELIQGSPEELTCYGTYHETNQLLNREYSRVESALKRSEVQENHPASLNIQVNHSPVLLPLSVKGKNQRIDYNDKEYKKLDGEEDAYKTEGYALTLSTMVNDSPLSVRVIYTSYDLYTQATFRVALSWQIGQLKARVYEKILILSEKGEMSQDHH